MSTNLSTKRCSQCKETKPVQQFYNDKTRKDGLRVYCKLCTNVKNAAWYAANPEKEKVHQATWRAANPDKRKVDQATWRKENPEKCNANNAKRRAAKLQAMLKYGKEHLQADIQVWYTRAKLAEQFTGEKYHVDHIVPLQGKTVSGLHVPWNLQLLTQSENCSKSNKYETT